MRATPVRAAPVALRTEAARLIEAQRVAQTRRAALVATLVLQYWRTRVDVNDPASVERWLDLLVPRILNERLRLASTAQVYGDRLRALEVPDVRDGYKFPAASALDPAAVRTSLAVTGPVAVRKKVEKARAFDFEQIRIADDTAPDEREALERMQRGRVALPEYVMADAKREAEKTIAGAVLRHVQSGSREVMVEGAVRDRVALGWVRVTKGDPCYFCAMLASRGLENGGVYDVDSFDRSDPRFVGTGTAKVHDSCGCGMKAVYTQRDEILLANKRFADQWYEFSGGKGDPLINFRRGYEGRA